MKICILLLYLSFPFISFSQKTNNHEKKLLNLFQKIAKWSPDKYGDKTYDSLQVFNDVFEKYALNYLNSNPKSIRSEFHQLQKLGLYIATSKDGLFRIYSWDNQTGGTQRFYNNIYQYNNQKKVIAKKSNRESDGDSGGFFSEISTINHSNKRYYLGYFHAIYSTADCYDSVKAFYVTSKGLERVKLFKTENGLTDELGFEFDPISVIDRKERPIKLIHFDSLDKTIKIPIIQNKGLGKVTNKFITYRFNGQYFKKVN